MGAGQGGASASGTAKSLVDEAITTTLHLPRGLDAFYRAALPLSRATLTYLAGVIRRHRKLIGACWRKLNPGQQALLVLVHLRKGETFAALAAERANAQLKTWHILCKLRCCPWRAG